MEHFFAYLGRLKFIKRWGLMRSAVEENTQEHSYQVAVVAHALAIIKNKLFAGQLDDGRVAVLALYHDASEVLTGDLPTPIKYANAEIKAAYHQIENSSRQQMLGFLPEELRDTYKQVLLAAKDSEEMLLVHIADKICAYIKCLEELMAGNAEYTVAKEQIEAQLNEFGAP